MTAKIQVRRDTTANWNAGTPPTLDVGEIGLDTDLKQIKIGDNSSNWTALPWLGGTLPYYDSPSTNIDDAANRVAGLYRWAGIASITSGVVPAAPIDIKTADGGINMLVLKFGTTVMQHLWTDGDGTATAPPKSYSRVYDGDVSLWRAWVPQNIWGISATEGVDVVAKKITLKDTTTGLVVDGASTLTGTATFAGTATFGGVASFTAGTAALPAITTTGDTNTGIAFTAADQIVVSTAGSAAITVNASQHVTMAGNLTLAGTVAANLSMGGNKITSLANPTSSQDAVTKAYLESNRIGQIAYVTFNTQGIPQTEQIGLTYNASPAVFTNISSGLANIRCPANQEWRGLAIFQTSPLSVRVTSSSFTDGNGNALNAGNPFAICVIRIS